MTKRTGLMAAWTVGVTLAIAWAAGCIGAAVLTSVAIWQAYIEAEHVGASSVFHAGGSLFATTVVLALGFGLGVPAVIVAICLAKDDLG